MVCPKMLKNGRKLGKIRTFWFYLNRSMFLHPVFYTKIFYLSKFKLVVPYFVIPTARDTDVISGEINERLLNIDSRSSGDRYQIQA